ncbi:MAG: MBL fold metallo-hydrolase [Candidatus Thorarchaeota archaeon]
MFDSITNSVHVRVSDSFDSNIGYLDCGDRKILIDSGTGMFTAKLEQDLQGIGVSLDAITDIVLTHSHIDHIGGVIPLIERFSPKIHAHKVEADMINSGNMGLTLSETFGAKIPPFKIEGILEDQDVIDFGDLKIKVLHTPGHSAGSICLHLEAQGVIFTGDTMFSGGSFGRVDLPGGNPGELVESLKKLSEIDFQIALPGHMSPVRGNARNSAKSSYEMAKNWFRV